MAKSLPLDRLYVEMTRVSIDMRVGIPCLAFEQGNNHWCLSDLRALIFPEMGGECSNAVFLVKYLIRLPGLGRRLIIVLLWLLQFFLPLRRFHVAALLRWRQKIKTP